MSVNYTNCFIMVSAGCKAEFGTAPTKAGTVAALQYEMLAASPYRHTSEDVIFGAYEARNLPDTADLGAERAAFFAKPQACLRASPLVKTYGWGLHHDAMGRVALAAVESPVYAAFLEQDGLDIVAGMRSKRA